MKFYYSICIILFLSFCSFKSYADITGCAINGDTTFYPNDLGYVYYAPYSHTVRSFNGTPTSMSNWSDSSGLACGTYYYDHSTSGSRENCIAYNNDGSVASTGGSVTIIKQKCAAENLPLDSSLYYLLAVCGFYGFFVIKKSKLMDV
ncbi:hypothetical protein [uncultured Pedobacter sp.]|uniref:hypothetical protein n=1 Tax=uncultured Pedobacter sp. TaxID=246139 RepID=UPI0025E29E92|nr:hypothetical protein [uncultured Pedobacter sp.]